MGVSLKVLFVGELGVGKTSLAKQYSEGVFTATYKATVGCDYMAKVVKWEDSNVSLQCWDIAGQERFNTMTDHYFRDSHGAIVIYDVTVPKTLEAAKKWKMLIDQKVGKSIAAVLVGNKRDLDGGDVTKMDDASMRKFLDENGFAAHFLTTAKDHDDIDKVMQCLLAKMFALDHSVFQPQEKAETVALKSSREPAQSGCQC